ncbi:MAG: tRNA pseudouridine(38-40) synthase TruA [Candidatus Aadella gelida]|nr:tRNA pseudouridine(38-40) synthase TruA [Candidatus Aadella gelida]
MRTIKLTISYDGTKYNGWQLQKNGPSIQEEIEKSLNKLFGKMCRVHGSGRTDAGVHALKQTAHFKTAHDIPVRSLSPALNRTLPEDIVVIKAEEMNADFHARFDTGSKTYRYRILNSEHADPFLEKYSWRVPYKLNLSLMKREAKVLEGRHDFSSFRASDKREGTSVREISHISIKKQKSLIEIEVEGDGFLYNMVRNIVGTLVDIGRGYLPPESMKKILKKKDRTSAGPTAPAKGLFLAEVKY